MLHKDKIQRKISPFIHSQLPLYLDLHYDKVADGSISIFGRFMQLYYEWLETSYDATIDDFKFQSIQQVSDMAISELHSENGNVYDRLVRLESFRDVDNTIYKLLQYIKSEYNPDLPSNTYADDRKLIKRIKEIYRARGTESVFSIFFRILYQKIPVTIYPKEQMFTVSESDWKEKKSIRVKTSGSTTIDDHESFKGYYIVGLASGAKAVVESVTIRNIGSELVTELYLDLETGITGTFQSDEVIVVQTNEGFVVNKSGTSDQMQAKITPSAQGVTFTNKGSGYYLDDAITLANVQETTMIIKKLAEGSVEEFYTSGIVSGDTGTEVNFVNDYLEVYSVEGSFAQNDTLTGAVSGATAKLRFIDGNRYWVDTISGTFKTDESENGEYLAEEITNGTYKRLRADRIVTICDVSASATVIGANMVNINSGGVGYRGLPKAYLTEASIASKILLAYSSVAGGIEEVEVITKGLADNTSTVTTKEHPEIISTTLTDAINDSVTTIVVSSAIGINEASILKIGTENLSVSAVSGTSLTVNRGVNSTTAASHSNGASVSVLSFFIRATGTVTYGAMVDHGGSGSSLKSNVSDSESYVQDLDYYQWWSYKVRASEDPNKWRGQLNKFAHPAGMKIFTEFTIDNPTQVNQTVTSAVCNTLIS